MDHVPTSPAAFEDRFRRYQADPDERLRVKLRRVRAAQIQRFFAQPEQIDFDTFNRDIWVFESRSLLGGEPIKELYWNIPMLSSDQKKRIEEALDADDVEALELHGNYVWGTGTSVYGPMLKDLTQRTQNIQNAAEFLNDNTLAPEDKADLLKQIPGFSNNTATGLVMLFHPDRYAIYNSQSEEAIRTFGYDVRTLPEFQEAAKDLKTRLGATDFLELDWFLHQENNRESEELDQDRFISASRVPDKEILEKKALDSQHRDYRTLTAPLLARAMTEIQSGARVGCLVHVGAYYWPAEILGNEIRFDPSVSMGCHFVRMRRANGDNVEHKITRRSILIMEPYAKQLESGSGLLTEPRRSLTLSPATSPQFWWVNQESTYAAEREGEYLWAPKQGQGGQSVPHHMSMASVRAGDWVLHYSQGSLRAVSQVDAATQDAPNPFDNHQTTWQRDGYLIKSTYEDLIPPIALKTILAEWRTADAGPFNKHGGVNQGYLYTLAPDFVQNFVTEFAVRLPDTFQDVFLDAAPVPQAPPLAPTVAPAAATDPTGQTPRMVKVAPGIGANFWQDCLQGGYICVGWDGVGDLKNYPSEAEFRKAFEKAYPYKNKQGKPSRSKMSAKANELWKFRSLQPGDLVAANEGASKILGVGTVLAPAYEYRPDRSEFYHTVRVQWDTNLACAIPMQRDWPMKTVSEISPALADFILSGVLLPPVLASGPSVPTLEPLTLPPAPTPSAPQPSIVIMLPDYQEPPFAQIETDIAAQGLRLDDGLLRRYHLALKTRGFVILSGISGTGKTWLAEAYANSIGAQCTLVPVAPNWTTNEDLLGYLNPLSGRYHDTDFSLFLRRASGEYHRAQAADQTPHPYHVILDEMNLARVEYYFAKFLSLMEHRARHGEAPLPLGDEVLTLPPNLKFIGTVNVDETTHGFADKVYDRAQLLELMAPRQALADHIGDALHRDALLAVWDAVSPVAPFAFRVIDEIRAYLIEADALGISWQTALDEQLLQKVLPKLKGTDLRLGLALQYLTTLSPADFPRTVAKAGLMHEGFTHHGFASYF